MVPGKEYHKYDFFVYPKSEKGLSWYRQTLATITRKFKNDEEEMANKCLNFYLEPWMKLLVNDGEFSEGFKINEFFREVSLVLESHLKPQLRHWNTYCQGSVVPESLNKVCTPCNVSHNNHL